MQNDTKNRKLESRSLNIMTLVALICFKYPPEYSGYGKQLKSVITKINEIDSNTFFTLLTGYESTKSEENEYLTVVPLGTRVNVSHSMRFYIFCLRTLVWLLINSNKYDVIHCIKAGPEAIVSNFASKVMNKRLIVKVAQDELSDREITNINWIKLLLRKARHFLIRNSDNFIAISEEIEGSLLKRVSNNTNIIRIPNGVDTDHKFIPPSDEVKIDLRKLLKLPKDNVIVLFVGAIHRRKGIYDLLKSIKDIKVNIKFSLVICGPILDDIGFNNLIEEINQCSPKVNVIYKGKVNNVDEYMKASDIFVLPSYSEGLPNVLLEAASCGLALVSTDIGGSRDIVKDSINGRIVSLGEPMQLSNALSELIDSKELQEIYGEMARQIAISKYSLKQVAISYIDLYKKLR